MIENPALKHAARRARSKLRSSDGDSDYTDEEFEFLKAMDRYKRDYHRPNPTCCEVLAVLMSLGWRKVVPDVGISLCPTTSPTPPKSDDS